MNYQLLTNHYYSLWLGEAEVLCNKSHGIYFIYSNERNAVQYGYSAQFDLYAFCQNDRIMVSYGDKAVDKIKILKDTAVLDFNAFKNRIKTVYGKSPSHHIKYCFAKEKNHTLSRTLTKADFALYLAFFKSANPDCSKTDWVEKYFDEMIMKHICCGVFENGVLVSCTDAPSMPYMADKVQEIGINTLSKYCGKGYAADACALCAKNITANGKCPQWSTSIDNIASQHLAEKAGFEKLADVLTLTL